MSTTECVPKQHWDSILHYQSSIGKALGNDSRVSKSDLEN